MDTATDTYAYATGTNIIYTVTGGSTTTYTHDANGNITGIGDKVLTYNQNNRLIEVEEDSVTLGEYTYNGLGQRIIKEAGEVTTVFHYDFDGNIIAESNLAAPSQKSTSTREITALPWLMFRGAGGGRIYYYGNDQLGTPQILTNSSNTVVWEGVYKPFGEADINPNSTVVNNFRFPGQYYDKETELHYNYHRYYDPNTGRYLRPDPLNLEIIQIAKQNLLTSLPINNYYQYIFYTPQLLNIYLYVLNNPISYSDPTGEIFPIALIVPTAYVLLGTVTTAIIAPFFLDVPKLPKGSPPGSLRPGLPGPVYHGPCEYRSPAPIGGPPIAGK